MVVLPGQMLLALTQREYRNSRARKNEVEQLHNLLKANKWESTIHLKDQVYGKITERH